MKRANYLQIFRWCGLVIFLLMIAAPIYWLFITAFKPEIDIFANPPQYLPGNITFEHFIDVWFGTSFPVFFRNSLLVAGTAGSITTIAATLAGYALAKFQFRLKSTILFLLIATQMFPILLLVVPLFTQLAAWKLVNSLTGLILVYAAFNIPFCVLLMRGFLRICRRSLMRARRSMAVASLARFGGLCCRSHCRAWQRHSFLPSSAHGTSYFLLLCSSTVTAKNR